MLKQLLATILGFALLTIASFSTFGHDDAASLLEDVNQDGLVNIQDLVLVASALGTPSDSNLTHQPDVNRDGIINILDLVRVGNRWGETPESDTSTYHEIQDYIFDKSCVNRACHGTPANAGGLNLAYEVSYQNLVGQTPRTPAAVATGMKLIDPGHPENSFLLTKLTEQISSEFGARMPLAAGPLHEAKIAAIRQWIASGAPEKGKVPGIGDLAVLRDPEETFHPPEPPPAGKGYQLHLPPFRVQPGTELEVFYATQITDENGEPLQEDIFVNGFDIVYPTGSHHFILYGITPIGLLTGLLEKGVGSGVGINPEDTFRILNPDDPQATGHLGVLERLPIIGSQRAETEIRFPEGVALRIPGGTLFDMNSHYINLLGTQPLIGETYVNLYTLQPEEVIFEARGFAVSNRDINVPPGTTQVIEDQWRVSREIRRRGYPESTVLSVFQITSHMHRHGELFEINRMSTGELLHRSITYDNAPLNRFDPPLEFTTGDGLRFQCTHSNYDTDTPIQYGLTSEDEMCIMFGFYYVPTTSTE